MRILLLQIDKTQESYLSVGCKHYTDRLKHYAQTDIQTITMPKSVRQRSETEQKKAEAKELLLELNSDDHVVLLDEQGKGMTSMVFANYLQKMQNRSVKRLVFVIGGPYGFDESIYQRASDKLALSQMTFSHQMVRLFFLEQLYRAFTILKGEKYHHS